MVHRNGQTIAFEQLSYGKSCQFLSLDSVIDWICCTKISERHLPVTSPGNFAAQLRQILARAACEDRMAIRCAPADETRTRGPFSQHIRTLLSLIHI